jgi:hypothetical protein
MEESAADRVAKATRQAVYVGPRMVVNPAHASPRPTRLPLLQSCCAQIRWRTFNSLLKKAVRTPFDTLRGGTFNSEDGLTRFAIRYICTHHHFSIDKARRDLGYQPRVSVTEGIEKTCRHLEATGAVY